MNLLTESSELIVKHFGGLLFVLEHLLDNRILGFAPNLISTIASRSSMAHAKLVRRVGLGVGLALGTHGSAGVVDSVSWHSNRILWRNKIIVLSKSGKVKLLLRLHGEEFLVLTLFVIVGGDGVLCVALLPVSLLR